MTNGNETKDYACTLEMPTNKAHEYRNYLIQLEKAWNSPEKIMARALQIANHQIETYKQQIEYQKPLVEFADKMLGSKDSLLIRVYAKLLNDEGLKIGEKKLYSWFRDNGYLNRNNEPYQQYMEYFEVKVSTYDTAFGTKTNTTTLIKPKGQLYFFKKLNGGNRMTQFVKKGTITSLELLEQINFFRAKEEKKETEHNTLLRTIRDEFEEEIGLNKIVQSSYKNKQNKEMPMFVLTIPQGKQVLARESKFVRKAVIHKLEELENKFKVPTNFKEALQLALEQQEIIEEQQKLIEHKEDVIIGLVEDIDLSTKRQRITQIVRHNSKNYQDRYNLLYKEFEKKYHCDLGVRLENYNNKNKPKMKNKMDYIDKVMNMIPQLYELTCKLFEGDVNTLKKQWFDIIEDKEVI